MSRLAPTARVICAERQRAEREFEYTVADFERARRLIHARAGIALGDHKQEMVYSRLARRLRALRLTSFRQYLDRVETDAAGEWDEFTNALTTNLTAFFREAHHFDTLRERLRAWGSARRCRIWCAAASTGEEPYSIAMTLVESFSSFAPPGEILATDLDTSALRKAERAVYSTERLRGLSPEQVRRYFLKAAPDGSQLRIREELARLVGFRRLNLLDPSWHHSGVFDAIFCRNVLIYFDKPTQRRIVERFVPLLRSDGLLFVGHSEGLFQCADLVRSLGRTVYQPITQSRAEIGT